jgi:hypothetical protein
MTTAHLPEPTLRPTSAEALNRDCYCRTLNTQRLREQLEANPGLQGLLDSISHTRPNLFSGSVVFMSDRVRGQIGSAVAAIERVASLPAFQAQALARADAVAQHDWGPRAVCMGYDFHLSAIGPQLIEINTNAGGLLLNAALARAQDACCDELDLAFKSTVQHDSLDQDLFAMFANEWQLQRGQTPWRNVLIVDSDPQQQYLAPEFALFQQLFAQHGIAAHIADPGELSWINHTLQYQGSSVDMVYNRLTDFYLQEPAQPGHCAEAYAAGAVVLTPHPRAHALLADKRNLIVLSSDAQLAVLRCQRAPSVQLLGAHVPRHTAGHP